MWRYFTPYREWVEQAGAASVVLPLNGSVEEIFGSINALMIPGGSTRPPTDFLISLIRRAIQASAEGDYFPVWGTCLGFQWMLEAVGGQDSIEYNHFDSEDFPGALNFTPPSPGRIFANASAALEGWFVQDNVTYENHVDGVEPRHFARSANLSAMFDILATSVDRKGLAYVAVVEAKSLPLYGIQFHPEKIRFVNNNPAPGYNLHIPKTPKAQAASDYLANFFVGEARRNTHRVPSATHAATAEACENAASLCSCDELDEIGYVDAASCTTWGIALAIAAFCRSGTQSPCQRLPVFA